MVSTLNKAELLAMRTKVLDSLEQKYGVDPEFGLLKSLDLTLSGYTEKTTPLTAKPVARVRTNPKQNAKTGVEGIVEGAMEFFRVMNNAPVETGALVSGLRDLGVELPDNTQGAKISVGRVLALRLDTFERVPPSSKRFPMKWKLADAVFKRL